MKAFPEAKLILTIREPETWYESVKSTIYKGKNIHKIFPVNLFVWFQGKYPAIKMASTVGQAAPQGMDKSMACAYIS